MDPGGSHRCRDGRSHELDQENIRCENMRKLEEQGYLVLENAVSSNSLHFSELKKLAESLLRTQQLCISSGELDGHCDDPGIILKHYMKIQCEILITIQDQVACKIECWDRESHADVDYLRCKQSGCFTPAHSDSHFFLSARPELLTKTSSSLHDFYTVWMPFVDVSALDSHLEVIPRSHLDRDRELKNRAVRKRKWKPLLLSKGSLVIFNSYLLHRGSLHKNKKCSRTSMDFRVQLFTE
jgi:hypothetical protein